jgi:hypothetical protein
VIRRITPDEELVLSKNPGASLETGDDEGGRRGSL